MGNSVPLQNMERANPSSTTAASDEGGMKAKVLYDYDAADMTELSLAADEVGFCL